MPTVPIYKPLEIEVTDFGPIAKAKIELRPLTVFVGPSNTGKSYLAMLIYALHRFIGGHAYDSRLNRAGKHVKVGDLLERFFHLEVWSSSWGRELTAKECTALIEWTASIFSHRPGEGIPGSFHAPIPETVAHLVRPLLRDVRKFRDSLEMEVTRCFGSENVAQLIRHGTEPGFGVALRRRAIESNVEMDAFAYELTVKPDESKLTALIPDTNALHIKGADDDPWYGSNVGSLDTRIHLRDSLNEYNSRIVARRVLADLANVVGSYIFTPMRREAHFLPADRASLMHTNRVVVASIVQQSSRAGMQRDEPFPALSGVLADFLAQLIAFGDSPRNMRRIGESLAARLEKEVLSGQVVEDRSAAGHPVFFYRPKGRSESIPLMRASSMVSELTPVILYLRHLVQPGDVLIIEEPEAHLHPGMQAAFTRQIAAIVRAGVRVMLTTHSDYVLEELANLVRLSELPEAQREGLTGADAALSPEEVGVWLFEPKKRPKGSVVKEVPLDADVGLYSAGYGDVSEALYNTSVEIDNRIGESKSDYESG